MLLPIKAIIHLSVGEKSRGIARFALKKLALSRFYGTLRLAQDASQSVERTRMPRTTILTIGHSDHDTETFMGLLRQHDIILIVDVRSQPYSRWASQFNRESLRDALEAAGLGYHYMGDKLGGRPSDPNAYASGGPDYGEMEASPSYQAGIDELLELGADRRLAVMCSEGDYRECHRHLLITQTLLKRGARVVHVKPDGQTAEGERVAQQLSLF